MAVKLTFDGITFPDGSKQEEKAAAKQFYVFNERMHNCQQCAHAGGCCEIANGKCCQWTVPNGITHANFDIWSGGGGGAGSNCGSDSCSYGVGGAGGGWAVKAIPVTEGSYYTICAGGVYPCNNHHGCSSGEGCSSYVLGPGLNNFCVKGGCTGIWCNGDAWGHKNIQSCANTNICMHFGADFGMAGTTGMGSSASQCHCLTHIMRTGQAPWIGLNAESRSIEHWCTCGCFIPGFGSGGMSGDSTYCGSDSRCCAAGNMGGPGIVKVTYS